tara:strand:- start:2464 stop:2841 length:378 start_codon:yes stop_codon:yes gene_type:complete
MDNQQIQNPQDITNELITRIRILEGKYNLTRERMIIINQNMLDHYKKLNTDIKSIKEDIEEIKDTINLLKTTSRNIVKELKLFARKDDLKILEKYINIWNPINMVTKEEVIELIEKRLKNEKTKK